MRLSCIRDCLSINSCRKYEFCKKISCRKIQLLNKIFTFFFLKVRICTHMCVKVLCVTDSASQSSYAKDVLCLTHAQQVAPSVPWRSFKVPHYDAVLLRKEKFPWQGFPHLNWMLVAHTKSLGMRTAPPTQHSGTFCRFFLSKHKNVLT